MISVKAQEVCLKFGARLIGDGDFEITGVADPRSAIETSACFITNPVYLPQVRDSRARFWVLTEDFYNKIEDTAKTNRVFALTPEPYVFFSMLAGYFFPEPKAIAQIHPQSFIHPEAKVHPSAQVDAFVTIEKGAVIDEEVILGSGTFIGEQAHIGAESHLYPGVKIYHHTIVGKRNILHSGVVLGSDGFGFIKKDGRNLKIPQVGRVVTKDDVEMGANTTVDRGAFGDTIIGEGVKFDDQVMIGHNCVIGDHSLICAQSGMSGNTILGKNVLISGHVGSKGHVKIGENVQVGGQSGITKDIPPGVNVKGYPPQPLNEYLRNQAIYLKLPEMYKKLLKLEKLFDKSKE